jgi:hypothetical protein
MRTAFILLAMLIAQLSVANMASPIWEGTYAGTAFSSRDIDILQEKIHITIDKEFKTAKYDVNYFIKADSVGKQIPLLFHAKDYLGDFKVWVDNQEIKLLKIPEEYITTFHTPFSKFSNVFNPPYREDGPETYTLNLGKYGGYSYYFNDLKYFEIDLSKGEHAIRVEYVSTVWTDISDWVKEYSFRYSLSPAKNWRSFGSLEVTIDASAFPAALKTNLGESATGDLHKVAVWNFSKLPAEEYIEIMYKPSINLLAQLLIFVSPAGFAAIFAVLIFLLHYKKVKQFRVRKPTSRYSWVVIVGSLVNAFLILVAFVLAYPVIDVVIGADASCRHGYVFLVIIFYPVVWLIYGTLMTWIDWRIKRKIQQ